MAAGVSYSKAQPERAGFSPLLSGESMTLLHKLALGAALVASSVTSWAADPQVELKTSMGVIRLALNQDKAPKTVDNFLAYVKSGHYKGTTFHRVIPGFMIQGGGFSADMTEKPTRAPIINEAGNGLKNEVGTIAMARTMDPNSATAQFFINVNDNRSLNRPSPDGFGYAVFGRVVDGMEVVNKIVAVPTGNRGMHQNVPRMPVVIEDATLISQ